MKEIEKFDDYRDYIKYLFDIKKIENSKTSFQSFASKTKLSKSYLKMVIDKKRHISLDNIPILANYFNLNNRTKQLMMIKLMLLNTKSPDVENYFKSIYKSMLVQKQQTKKTILSEKKDSLQYKLTDMAILDIVRSPKLEKTDKWIQEMLGGSDIISIKEVRSSLNSLIKNEFIFKDKNGYFQSNVETVFSDPSVWDDDGWSRFQLGLERAHLSLEFVGKTDLHNPCRYHMYSVGLSKKNIKVVTQLYDELKEKIEYLAEEKQDIEKIMFISNNIFSISHMLEY